MECLFFSLNNMGAGASSSVISKSLSDAKMQLGENACETHDLRDIFDNVNGAIYWDQGHVLHAGNLILAEKFFELSMKKIDSTFISEQKFTEVISNHNTSDDLFSSSDTIRNLSAIPLTVKSNDTHIFVGLDDNQGCYIKLLDSNNENNSNFTIAPGYDIQDIDLSSNHITLSAGYYGALIYDSNFELVALLDGLYAYRAMMYDDFNIIVGTKDGLCIYQLER